MDDNQDLAFTLKIMLEAEGHEVKSSKDGKEAYLTYLGFEPDLVLTDIQMPERNGLELMEVIRLHDPGVRTIYMSGDLNQFLVPLEEEKGKYRVSLLEKPFSRVDLMRLVSALQER